MKSKCPKYRVVPTTHEKFSCWAVKDGETLVKVFTQKHVADQFVLNFEKRLAENFSVK
jgi:hypothetical protein